MEAVMSNINGTIWLFFDAAVEWELLMDTEQQVTISLYHQDIDQHIIMTFVYAKCSSIERLELWDYLYYLATDMNFSWMVGGDFNFVLHEDEKIGGLPVYPSEYEDFAFCVNSCGLFDLGYKGSPFTWWNEVDHLIRTGSNHAPLLMSYGKEAMQFVKPFKFLKLWTKHDTFKQVLAIREDIVRVKEMLFEEEPTIQNRIVLQQEQAELKKYLSIEEQYWKQKAGIRRFAEDDKNTRCFHNHFNGKRQNLKLKRIQNAYGTWLESQDLLANAAVDFFHK
ncbi:uncharacterized protein LOC142163876 [Nicotiana tabacum]|uniref:Uncharacterized protein LOC142163876 n=1 Tax=Nicotiana tabacum TaxID=4097 RepID=A0AC58RWN5_TOBAC